MSEKASTKQDIIKVIEDRLDTRDKRSMFLRCQFKDTAPLINLDGSARAAAHNIYNYFENNNMLGSLMACLNSTFDENLTILIDTK